jgi:hypothetical protein
VRLRLLAASVTAVVTASLLAAGALPAGALPAGALPAGPARTAGSSSLAATPAVSPAPVPGRTASHPVSGADDPAVLTGEGGPVGREEARASAAKPTAAARGPLGGTVAPTYTPPVGYPVPKPAVPIPAALDLRADYVPQKSCSGYAKPGALLLRNLLMSTYSGTGSYGIATSCIGRGGLSEHLEGRAFDWRVNANVLRERKQAEAFLNWLLADSGANARRMGIMYVIWNSRIWGVYSADQGWRPYQCSGETGCHRDHVHISLTWDGAYARTSFWTGRALTVQDYGSCVVNGSYFAANHSWRAPRPTPCPTWRPLPATDPIFTVIASYANRNVSVHEVGPGMAAVQRILGGEPATGRTTSLTGQELAAFQLRRGLAQTGTITPQTWRSLASYASGGAVRLS